MSESFDPYRVWLGIPPEARPPTHYQLLGISPDETEQAVIEAAVLRQSGYVRNFQIGKYAKDAARILSEIAAAKACLLDPAKRAEYDAEQNAAEPAVVPVAYQLAARDDLTVSPSPALSDDLLSAVVAADTPLTAPRERPRSLRRAALKRPSRLSWQVLASFGVGVAVTLAAVGVWPRRPADERRESPSLVGTVSSDPPSLPPAPPSSPELTALHTEATTVIPPPPDVPTPQVLTIRTQTYSWPGDIARHEDDAFYVAQSGDYGWSAVGYELQDVRRVRVQVDDVGALRPMADNFFAGFLVDYHSPSGYSHRVGLCIGMFNGKRRDNDPVWGARLVPSESVDLTQQIRMGEPNDIDLHRWAPVDWDGRALFSVFVQNAGAGAHIEGRLTDPAPAQTERLPGEYRRLCGHSDSVTSLAFLPGGQLLSGSFDGTWALWEARARTPHRAQSGIRMLRWSGKIWENKRESPVRAVAVAPDGKTALISLGAMILHFELPTANQGNMLRWLEVHSDATASLSFSPDSRRAVTAGFVNEVRFWDLESGMQLWERGLGCWAYSAATPRNGRFIVVAKHCGHRPTDDLIRVFDLDGNEIRSISVRDCTIIGLSLSPDGKQCLVGSIDPNIIKLLNLESSAEIVAFDAAPGGGSVPVFSPDGRHAAWGGNDEVARVWNLENQTKVAEFEHAPLGVAKRRRHGHDWMPVAFSPDGTMLASGADDGTIYLWDVARALQQIAP